jgi:hypothetical protein
MVYPTTANKSLETPNHGTAVDVWDQPLNSDFNIIDKSFGGTISFNATTGSQTLTSGISDTYSYIPLIIQVGGSISANVVYTIPSGIGGQWVVLNNTTDGTGGPWTVSFVNAYSGTGVAIPRGYSSIINSDGITVRFSDSRVPSAAGSDRQIQFNSGGYLGAASTLVYDINGNLGVGTASPSAKLNIVSTSTEGGTTSDTFLATSGALPSTVGAQITLGSFGATLTNAGYLNFRAYRVTASPVDWTTAAMGLTYDVDTTIGSGGGIWFKQGNIGIGATTFDPAYKLDVSGIVRSSTGGFKFPDDSVQTTAAPTPTVIGQVPFSTNGTSYSNVQKITRSTIQAASGQTAFIFTDIPSWVKRITIMFDGISTTGTSPVIVQIGYDTTFTASYVSGSSVSGPTSGYSLAVIETAGYTLSFGPSGNVNAAYRYGALTLNLFGNNLWTASGAINAGSSTGFACSCSGSGFLTSTLDRVKITTLGGTDTFDAGNVNILYE